MCLVNGLKPALAVVVDGQCETRYTRGPEFLLGYSSLILCSVVQ